MATQLKRLSRRTIRSADVVRFFKSTNDLPDHALALVAGTLVERTLERVIKRRMVQLKPTESKELFVGLAPLASFSAKIKIAYALGILGRKGVSELEMIKDIRNQFAHSFHPIKFSTKAIQTACRNLRTPERVLNVHSPESAVITGDKTDPRSRYFFSCMAFWVALGGRSVNGPRPKRARDLWSRVILR